MLLSYKNIKQKASGAGLKGRFLQKCDFEHTPNAVWRFTHFNEYRQVLFRQKQTFSLK